MRSSASITPNLFVLGAQKAGTTWLFKLLEQHSEIFGCTPKEPFFFTRSQDGVRRDLPAYLARFEQGGRARYRMEASATYFWTRCPDSQFDDRTFQRLRGWRTPENLREACGAEPRFIVLLRQPVARAISAFFHHARRGRLDADARLLMAGRAYGVLDMGFYDRCAKRWLDAFPRDRFLFLNFDDLRRDPAALFGTVLRFLDLEAEPVVGLSRPANAGEPLIRIGDHLTVRSAALQAPPRIYAEEAVFLRRVYAPAIDFCEELLAQDLSGWRADSLDALLTL